MIKILTLIAAIAVATSIPVHAGPKPEKPGFMVIELKNETQYESWVDIATTDNDMNMGWSYRKSFCMSPHASLNERFATRELGYTEMRVRADIKLHGCANGTHKEVYVRQEVMYHHNHFWLAIQEKPAGNFGMRLDRVM